MSQVSRQLTDYLLKSHTHEIMAEQLRVKIAQNPYFQVETVFERMDKFKKGHLVPDDLSEFMLEGKVYPSEMELYLVFRDFDKDRVGVVTIKQFQEELLPK